MTLVIKEKHRIVVPESVRLSARLKAGDEVEFPATPAVITIIAKRPVVEDQDTPAQREFLDSKLAEGLADVKAGRLYGPFETNGEMINFLHAQAANAKPEATSKSKRR